MTSVPLTDQALELLSPTRAWRLTKCPASVSPVMNVGAVGETREVNTGTLAHRVLERWIAAEGYRAPNPRQTLSATIDQCVTELDGGIPTGWVLARARLLVRGAALAELVGARSPDEVMSEQRLTDRKLRLQGTPDLVLLGDDVILIDLKTQTFTEDDVPNWVKFQLAIYAHLVEHAYGKRPDRVEVLSLNRGQISVTVTDESISDALEAVASARELDRHEAKPEQAVCYFCQRRLECQPHWEVSGAWPDADCIEGTVQCIEEAATGVVAVLVKTEHNEVWVTRVPTDLMLGSISDQVRFVRLGRIRTSDNGVIGRRWERSSMLLVTGSA